MGGVDKPGGHCSPTAYLWEMVVQSLRGEDASHGNLTPSTNYQGKEMVRGLLLVFT